MLLFYQKTMKNPPCSDMHSFEEMKNFWGLHHFLFQRGCKHLAQLLYSTRSLRTKFAEFLLPPPHFTLKAVSRKASYPEAVFVAVDVKMLYDDLRAVSDLTAAVSTNRFTGPVKEQKSEFLHHGASVTTVFSPIAGSSSFLLNTSTALHQIPASTRGCAK